MAVRMINSAIRGLDFARVREALESPDRREDDSVGVFVCEATKTQWLRYVLSESQTIKSCAMEWRAFADGAKAAMGYGSIYIVELRAPLQANLVIFLGAAIRDALGARNPYFFGCGSAPVEDDTKQPDLSYGPSRSIGAVRPLGMPAMNFLTLKVEVGVTRGWRQLRDKADHWSSIPGVVYVLLVRVTPSVRTCQYTLYEVVPPGGGREALVPVPTGQVEADIDLANGSTAVLLDSRRLLALPDNVPLPPGFATPLVINLSDVIQRVVYHLSR